MAKIPVLSSTLKARVRRHLRKLGSVSEPVKNKSHTWSTPGYHAAEFYQGDSTFLQVSYISDYTTNHKEKLDQAQEALARAGYQVKRLNDTTLEVHDKVGA